MKKYIIPELDCLIFDEEEDILTVSVQQPKTYDYATGALNDVMINGVGISTKGTTTVKIENIISK